MYSICLTGAIAAGKSVLADMLADRGAVIVDADATSRRLTATGGRALPLIAAEFPGVVRDGELDRAELGRRVFADDEARGRLEAILHPLIRQEMDEEVRRAAGKLVLTDIPLMIETGRGYEPAILIAITAPAKVRLARMVEDRGMSEADARARMVAQATDEERATHADILIDNSGSLEDLEKAATDLMARLEASRRAWHGEDSPCTYGDAAQARRIADKIAYHGGWAEPVGSTVRASCAPEILRAAGCVDLGGWVSADVGARIVVECVPPTD